MANRHKDFNELVASKFEDIEFAREYVMHLINDEGLSLEESLRQAITSMGLQKFSNKAELSIQYVSDFVNRRKRLSTDSIDKHLQRVFNLRIKVSVESIQDEVA